MLEAKFISYKKFAVSIVIPVFATDTSNKSDSDQKWTSIDYLVRFRIPLQQSSAMLKPCDDKKCVRDIFDKKFDGKYRIMSENSSVRLEDGRIFNVYLPVKIKVYKSLQELRDISINSLME